jgi:hypothetical protein
MTRVVSLPAVVVLSAFVETEQAEDLARVDGGIEAAHGTEIGAGVDLGQRAGEDDLGGRRRGGDD